MTLRGQAHVALAGVGDAKLGQWEEWTGYAFHVRRRLSAEEEKLVGCVVDLRGTEEAEKRLDAAKIPSHMRDFARREIRAK